MRLCLLCGMLAALVLPARAQTFSPGEIYTLGLGVVRHADPVAGTITDFATLSGNFADLSYDPHRERLLVCRGFPPDLVAIDALGDTAVIASIGAASIAPTGDGRIYLGRGSREIEYLDECDAIHTVFLADCDVPFTLPSVAEQLIYDPGTNALFAASNGLVAEFRRIPLSPDGTRVSGLVETVTFSTSTTGNDVAGLSRGPNGELFAVIDTNDVLLTPHLITIDPVSLVITPFAQTQNGGHFSGSYDSTTGVAYVALFQEVIHSIPPGTIGNGDPVITGTGFVPAMVIVGESVGEGALTTGSGDCNGNGMPDGCDLAAGTSDDCNGNAIPDECDIASGVSEDLDGNGVPDECDGIVATGFDEGDIYIRRFGPIGPRLERIDPITGCSSLLTELTDAGSGYGYDPYRDRLVLLDGVQNELHLYSHTGQLTIVPYDWVASEVGVAPAGDGRTFLGSLDGRLAALDFCGLATEVQDETGTAPFTLPSAGPAAYEAMLYDRDQHWLYAASGGTVAQVHRIPLTPDGSQLAGPVETVVFDLGVGCNVTGLSRGPAGTLLLSVDDNVGDLRPRLVTVSELDLTITPFAETQTGAQVAGSYHTGRDEALVLVPSGATTGNVFALAEGDTWADRTSLSVAPLPGGTGLLVIGETLLGIPLPSPTPSDCNANGTADVCDIALGLSPDCNDNEVPDECDVESGFSLDTNGDGRPDECETPFIRGDVDGNGAVIINDTVLILGYLFQSGSVACLDACDLDDDGVVQLNDAVLILNFLFQFGAPPPLPYPDCGLDPNQDAGDTDLGCEGPLPGCP